ncbi:unnamed protein product [Ambrosiozyma monospora]|uniref:Unnamed protein product n=1 Tax=Ambrosiozyma monospora TaxID=43982 RepID=A0A9W6YV81_AMBMO|nr:unnamed protein product [Ambrosiozyma monospora]
MSSNMQVNQNSLRTSDFPPKVYDSENPRTSVLHYNLWRVFVDRLSQEQQQQADQQQQSDQQQQQQSDQQPSTGNEGHTRSSKHEDIQRSNPTTEDSSDTTRGQKECTETTSLSNTIPYPRGIDPTSLDRQEQIRSLMSYASTAPPDIARHSIRGKSDSLDQQWNQSYFQTREKDYPGCTVTIADFNETSWIG